MGYVRYAIFDVNLFILTLLRSKNSRTIVEDEIAQTCIGFNLKRVKAYYNLLQRHLQQYLATLRTFEELKSR